MKEVKILAVFLLCVLGNIFILNAQSIENIKFKQSNNKIYIYYTILGGKNTTLYNAKYFCSEDSGKNWGKELQAINKTATQNISGKGEKVAVWDVLKERKALNGNAIRFKIKLTEINFINKSGFFTDSRDNCKYFWVKIGNQIWLSENLNFSAHTNFSGSDNKSNNKKEIYTFKEAKKSCPIGWKLPSDKEWQLLEKRIKTTTNKLNKNGWRENRELASLFKNTDYIFNFSELGYMNSNGKIRDENKYAYFWASTKDGNKKAYYRKFSVKRPGKIYRNSISTKSKLAVLCIKINK